MACGKCAAARRAQLIREKYGSNEKELKKLDEEDKRYHHVNKGDKWYVKLLKRSFLLVGTLIGGLFVSAIFLLCLIPVVLYVIFCICIGKGDNMHINPYFWLKKKRKKLSLKK